MTAFESNLAVLMPAEEQKQELTTQSNDLSSRTFAITQCETKPVYDQLLGYGGLAKGFIKDVKATYKDPKQKADAVKRSLLDMEKAAVAPLEQIVEHVRRLTNGFVERERLAAEELARKERVKAEERAERERQRLLNRAAKAEDKGRDYKAEELLAQAEEVYVAPVVAQGPETTTANGHTQGELEITVLDVEAFMAELLRRKLPPTMFKIQVGPLKAFCKSLNLTEFPGLHIKRVQKVRIVASK